MTSSKTIISSSSSPPMTTPPPKKCNTAVFQLLPSNDLVAIPEEMFIWSNFLREYKKGMLDDNNNDGEGLNYDIPLAPILGQTVQRIHLDKLYEFFKLFYRHTYGSGSSVSKKVPSSIDLRGPMMGGNKTQTTVVSSNGVVVIGGKLIKEEGSSSGSGGQQLLDPASNNEALIAAIEARSNAKWSALPDWAHGWFSALDKDVLIGSANVANFLTATPFIELYTLFIAVKVREMDNERQIMKYLNAPMDDPEGEELKKLLYSG